MAQEKAAKKAEKQAEKEKIRQEKIKAKEEKSAEKKEKKQSKKKNRSRSRLVAFLVVSVLVLGAVGGLFWYDYQQETSDKVQKNVYFQGENLGGLSKSAAKAKVEASSAAISGRTLVLRYGESSWEYTAAALGLKIDSNALFEEVWKVGRSGNIVDRYKDRLVCFQGKKTIVFEPKTDAAVLEPILTAIGEELGVNAVDASFAFDENGGIYIVPSKDGVLLDVATSTAAIEKALADQNIGEVALTVNINAEPQTTTADLEAMKINGILATFKTNYNSGEKDRSHNLWQSCQYLDMKMVQSGETFSFNSTVGERTTARGFRNAMIIENGEYTPGMGGGVCQVSTTLYGALLRTAHLKVTDRQHHSLVSSYVDPGQDAMVAWGSSDLCFINEYSTPILIRAVAGGGTMTMTIYGDTSYYQEVKIVSNVVRYIPYTTETKIDATLAPGEEQVKSSGKRGLECYVYKKVYENGAEVSFDTVSHDTYKAQTRVVIVGP